MTARKLVKPEPNLCMQEFLLQKSAKYWDELEKCSTDDVNSLISDLLGGELNPFEIPLPDGSDYSKAPAGYIIALKLFVDEFLTAQNFLFKGKSLVGGVRKRINNGESIGRWRWEADNVQ
jgi:hypothetical protein